MSKKPRINIILKLFYWLLKGVVLLTIRIYYGKIEIINAKELKFDGPCILVSNHQSTMMDPLHVACRVDYIVHFLANASLFQTKFTNWFFNTFYCIPVARKKDKTKIKIDNGDSFQKAFNFLMEGGCLYIAPEGVSTQEHDLKPLKTGTARVALGTEAQNNFSAGVKILPVGIYYEDAQRFRRRVLLNVGQPIPVAPYQSAYKQDDRATVNQLTDDLEKKLAYLLIVTDDDEKDKLFRLLESIQNLDQTLPLKQRFSQSQKLAAWLHENPNANTVGKAKQLLQYLQTNNESISVFSSSNALSFESIVLGLFAPLGWLFNLLPASIVYLIRKKANLYDGYTSTVLILSSLIVFPICYRLNNFILSNWVDIGWWWPVTWIAYGLLGLLSWKTLSQMRTLIRKGQFNTRLSKSEAARDAKALCIQIKEELHTKYNLRH